MTLEEAIGVNVDIDAKTGEKLTHSEKYGRAIELLGGLEVVSKLIPFPLETLRKAYKSDKHFNNTQMKEWDYAAGFITKRGDCDPHGGGLWHLYRQHSINSASCAEGVCVLKEAARRLVERAEFGRTEQEKDKPLMFRLLAVGYPLEQMSHHESDLYVYKTALTTRVIEQWCRDNGYNKELFCLTFKDNVTGKQMYDCAFQYYAEYKEKEGEG